MEVPGNNLEKDLNLLTSDKGYVDEGHSDKAVRPKNFDTSPSVRALASKFDGPTFKHGVFQNGSFEHKEDGTTIVRIDTKVNSGKFLFYHELMF